jgi:hypothetical protein
LALEVPSRLISADLIDSEPFLASTTSFVRETEVLLARLVRRWLTLMVANSAAGLFVGSLLTEAIYFWARESLELSQGSIWLRGVTFLSHAY